MNREEIKNKVLEIIIKCLDIQIDASEIEGDNMILELGINSIDALEIFVWIENTFEIQIEDEDLSADLIESLDSIVNYVLKKTSV